MANLSAPLCSTFLAPKTCGLWNECVLWQFSQFRKYVAPLRLHFHSLLPNYKTLKAALPFSHSLSSFSYMFGMDTYTYVTLYPIHSCTVYTESVSLSLMEQLHVCSSNQGTMMVISLSLSCLEKQSSFSCRAMLCILHTYTHVNVEKGLDLDPLLSMIEKTTQFPPLPFI